MNLAPRIAMFVLVGIPAVAIITRVLRLKATTVVAVLQDATPVLLILAWVGLAMATIRASWVVAAVAALLCAYHLVLIARLVHRVEAPSWTRAAPKARVAVANVYVDNDDMEAAARQLAATEAEVLVVVETTERFRAAFDAVGGRDRFPHAVFDPDDDSDYAVSLYTNIADASLGMIDIGPLRATLARVPLGNRMLHVVGAIPVAAVDRGGYGTWRRQLRALSRYAASHRGPLVIVGDLNTTIHRAAFTELRDAGLADAHDTLGKGLRPSFKLAAAGALARLGPLVRLDHALCNRKVWATRVDDLDAAGSDHRPFVVTLAVRPSRSRRLATPMSAPRTPTIGSR